MTTVTFDTQQEQELIRQIALLPEDGKQALFGKYCFRIAYADLEEALLVRDAERKAALSEALLHSVLGIPEDKRIDDAVMRKCCDAALAEYIAQTEEEANRLHEERPDAEKRKLRRKSRFRRMLRAAGAAAAVVAACLAVTFTASADFRARVLNWFIEDHVEYSEFRTESDAEVTIDDLMQYEPTYIPERFTFWEKFSGEEWPLVTFDYVDPDDYILSILLQLPGEDIMMDTEDFAVEQITWNGEDAYLYLSEEKGGRFVFTLDGFPVYIAGPLTRDEMLDIARGIQKN